MAQTLQAKKEKIWQNRWHKNHISVVQPHYGTLLRNEKEPTIDTHDNIDKSQRNYAEWKKRLRRWWQSWFHSYDILELAELQRRRKD